MQRVFTLTMFKVWVAMCESPKYSTGHFDEYDLCERINDVDDPARSNEFQCGFQLYERKMRSFKQTAKYVGEIGPDGRLPNLFERTQTSIRLDSKRNGRIGKALASIRSQALDSTEAAASGKTDDPQNTTTEAAIEISDRQGPFEPKQSTADLLPASRYEGRKLPLLLSYCNESKAERAAGSLPRKLP